MVADPGDDVFLVRLPVRGSLGHVYVAGPDHPTPYTASKASAYVFTRREQALEQVGIRNDERDRLGLYPGWEVTANPHAPPSKRLSHA